MSVSVYCFQRPHEELLRRGEEDLNMPYMLLWERSAERRGKLKKAKETAKNLLEMGIDIDKIVKATGLKKEIVETLKGKYN
jgi:hypothetical protein